MPQTEYDILVYFQGLLQSKLSTVCFVTLDSDEDFNWDKPVIIVEATSTTPTTNSVQGAMIYGESEFTMTVLIDRERKKPTTYKKQIIDLVEDIKNVFKSERGKYIGVRSIRFADFPLGELKITGAVISVQTKINNHDYTLQD